MINTQLYMVSQCVCMCVLIYKHRCVEGLHTDWPFGQPSCMFIRTVYSVFLYIFTGKDQGNVEQGMYVSCHSAYFNFCNYVCVTYVPSIKAFVKTLNTASFILLLFIK